MVAGVSYNPGRALHAGKFVLDLIPEWELRAVSNRRHG
jgi:hypothetical protein